jgi:deazaflavin-dependent oxidoreductase (nitroreductase family)
MTLQEQLAALEFCYLTTAGRVTGRPHTIEIWFALDRDVLYMLAGNHNSDWVKNLRRAPAVGVRLGAIERHGRGRVVEAATPEDARARALVVGKYQPGSDEDLTDWGRTALVVAVELQ